MSPRPLAKATLRAGTTAALLSAGVVGSAAAYRARQRALGPALDEVAPEFRSLVTVWPRIKSYPTLNHGSPALRILDRLTRGGGRAITIVGDDGPAIDAYLYDSPERTRPSPAVLWIHGGGLTTGDPIADHLLANEIARALDAVVLSPRYRLAPEHRYPAAADDCYAALAWLHDEAVALGVDPERIAVAGASAGGGLAAVVGQMATDRGLPVAAQALVYPMLDHRTTRPGRPGRGIFVWTPEHNEAAWAAYLGDLLRPAEDRPYASAANRSDVGGLPPTWIGVGDLDLFYDEAVDYHRRLTCAGVPAELVVVAGMPHAGDLALWQPAAHRFRNSMLDWLRGVLTNDDDT